MRRESLTPSERVMRARMAAYTLHARHDPRETTTAARRAFNQRLPDDVDPGLGAVEAERAQFLVGDVGPDPAVAALDPLLELGEVRVEDLVAAHRVGRDLAPLAQPDVPGDRVGRAAGQAGRLAQAARQVERLEDLHHVSGMLHRVPPWSTWVVSPTPA